MYFFDLEDYVYNFQSDRWNETGFSGLVIGCAGGPTPSDWGDLLGTGRATRDAFLKAVYEWFVASTNSGYTETIDQGCSPSYLDLWVDYIEKKIDWDTIREELTKTIDLYRFNYDFLTKDPAYKAQFPTYEEWFEDRYNSLDQQTGSTTTTVNELINPYSNTFSAVTVTYNYGTSFENSDIITRVTDDENAMKAMMCSLKNMWSVIDGDTFDELVVDDNGDFLPNSGYTYNII